MKYCIDCRFFEKKPKILEAYAHCFHLESMKENNPDYMLSPKDTRPEYANNMRQVGPCGRDAVLFIPVGGIGR